MGEKVEADAPAAKSDGGNATVVLKMDMHCEGCAKKVRRAVRQFDGVEDVTTDCENNKIKVIGKVNPLKIKDKLEEKTKKKVEIISPLPKKEEKKADEKPEKKPEEKKVPVEEEKKKPKLTTVVLKLQLHCEGCITKISKIISKIEGVDMVNIDRAKDQVTVTGTMDSNKLSLYLKEKLKRGVDVIPPTKKDDGGNKKDHNKETSGGGEKKKDKASPPPQESSKEVMKFVEEKLEVVPTMEVRKFEHHPSYHQPSSSSYRYDPTPSSYSHSYAIEPYNYHQGYGNFLPPSQPQAPPPSYVTPFFGYEYDQSYHADPRLNAPQMFSDENPNGCFVM